MSLVEVLVAMVVMSAAAVLVTASQSALRQSQDHARIRTLTIQLAQSKMGRLLKLSPRPDSNTLGFTTEQLAKGAGSADDISDPAKGIEITAPPGDPTFAAPFDPSSPFTFYGFSFHAYAAVVAGEWPAFHGVVKYQIDIWRAQAPGAAPQRIFLLSTLTYANKNG